MSFCMVSICERLKLFNAENKYQWWLCWRRNYGNCNTVRSDRKLWSVICWVGFSDPVDFTTQDFQQHLESKRNEVFIVFVFILGDTECRGQFCWSFIYVQHPMALGLAFRIEDANSTQRWYPMHINPIIFRVTVCIQQTGTHLTHGSSEVRRSGSVGSSSQKSFFRWDVAYTKYLS